jgi:hypothetical protein
MKDTTFALDLLSDYYAQRDNLALKKQEQIDKILTPEIRQAISDIEAEFGEKGAAVTENIASLEAEIREAVKLNGATVKGAVLQAVWSKPRVTWDTKALDGYAAGHPEILPFRKEGEPSVSIRTIGKA